MRAWENLGFIYDEENKCLYHAESDITIPQTDAETIVATPEGEQGALFINMLIDKLEIILTARIEKKFREEVHQLNQRGLRIKSMK